MWVLVHYGPLTPSLLTFASQVAILILTLISP
jgi:hypothetical protein